MLITKEYQGIEYFDAWSDARYTKDRIIEEGKADEFDNFVELYFDGEVDETEFNDFLRYEDKFIFDELGITDEEDDDDDDDDEEDY